MSAAPPPEEGGVLIAQVHQLGGRVFGRILQRHGLTELNPAQGRIIHALWRQDGLPQGDLAERTKLDKSTLALMLDRLEAAGQIRRVRDPADARRRRIHLTERNRRLHGAFLEASREMLECFYRGLSPGEISAFETTLRTIICNLQDPFTPGEREGDPGAGTGRWARTAAPPNRRGSDCPPRNTGGGPPP